MQSIEPTSHAVFNQLSITNLRKYQDYFGSELLVSPLLEGIAKNISSYFRDSGEEYHTLMKRIQTLVDEILQYITILSIEKGMHFKLSDYFSK